MYKREGRAIETAMTRLTEMTRYEDAQRFIMVSPYVCCLFVRGLKTKKPTLRREQAFLYD